MTLSCPFCYFAYLSEYENLIFQFCNFHFCFNSSLLRFPICRSVTKSCLTLCNLMDCSIPGFPVLHYLLEFAQIHVHWVSDAIQPSPLLSPSLPFNLSQHQSFLMSWLFTLRWPKYQSFSFSISPSNEYSGLISLRIF